LIGVDVQFDFSRLNDIGVLLERQIESYSDRIITELVKDVKSDIIAFSPDELKRMYKKALVVRENDRGGMDVFIDDKKLKPHVKSLDPDITVLYFKRDGEPQKDGQAIVDFMIKNSPFGLGYLNFTVPGIKTIARKVSRGEVQRVLTKNEKLKILSERLFKGYKGVKLPIEHVQFDLVFSAKRYEYGMLGYPKKEHWGKAERNINQHLAFIVNRIKKDIVL
jgi:hypothetical protein